MPLLASRISGSRAFKSCKPQLEGASNDVEPAIGQQAECRGEAAVHASSAPGAMRDPSNLLGHQPQPTAMEGAAERAATGASFRTSSNSKHGCLLTGERERRC